MQLPVPQPNSLHGASPSSYADADGVIFYSTFTNGAQRVYKLISDVPQEIPLEHLPTARGRLSVEPTGLWLTAWDEQHTALWRLQVPGWKSWPTAAGPKGDPGPAGKSIRYGSGPPPMTVGVLGEFYVDTSASRLYGPKTPTGWGAGISLIGPKGEPGPQGPPGADGGAGEAEAKLAAIRGIVNS